MPAPDPRRPSALLDVAVGAAAVAAGAAAMPLGLDATGSGPLLAGALAPGPGSPGAEAAARSPLAALAIRLAVTLPVGDLATRAHLASVALAALAAVLLARLAIEALAAARDGDPGRGAGAGGHQWVAAAAGALLPLACLNVFRPLTGAGSSAATLVLLAAGWLRVARLLRAPGRARDGLTLAFVTGLALAGDAVAAVLLLPLALGCWARSFRKGERWALLAPLLLIAGLGLSAFAAALGPAAAGDGPALAAQLGTVLPQGVVSAVSPTDDLVAELGVIAGLVALAGFVVLTLRVPVAAGLVMGSAVLAMAMHAGGAAAPAGAPASAWVALVALLGLPLAVGVAHLAGKLGPARSAAAVVVAVIALMGPALDGGTRRFRRSNPLPEALLREAHAELGPRLRVDPGSAPMRSLFGYGQAIGLRPDLTLAPPAATPHLPPLAARRSPRP